MIERLPNGTYEIAIQRRYNAANFSEYPGQLSFHCHLLVLMTSWRMGIKYKLFGEAGCVTLPPAIDNATMAVFGERTCWGTPRENSRVSYTCAHGYEIVGPHVLVCRNGSWVPDPVSQMNQVVSQMKELKLRMPYCGIRKSIRFVHHQIVFIFVLIFRLYLYCHQKLSYFIRLFSFTDIYFLKSLYCIIQFLNFFA